MPQDLLLTTPLETSGDSATANRPGSGSRVFVGNLAWSVKWQELKDHLQTVGQVTYADVLMDRSGRSKGCGLVEFASPGDAQQAIATLNDSELHGRKIFVREDREPGAGSIKTIANRHAPRDDKRTGSQSPPVSPKQTAKAATLFVRNLPFSVTSDQLRDHFQIVGEVDRAQVSLTPDGRSKGFGTVSFFSAGDAAKAIESLNGRELNGREIAVMLDRPLSERGQKH